MSICCGNQNRRLTVFDDNPPPKTANCYISGDSEAPGVFNPDKCNAENSACSGEGIPSSEESGCQKCQPSSDGGFCQIGSNYYSSYGGLTSFKQLTDTEVRSLFKTSTTDTEEISARRVLKDYDRRMQNKLREMQIMGRDVFNTNSDKTLNQQNNNKKKKKKKKKETESQINYYYLVIIIPLLILFLYFAYKELKKKYPDLKIFKLFNKKK